MKIPPIINKTLIHYFRFVAGWVIVILLLAGYLLLIAPKITEVKTTEATTRKNTEAELKTQQDYLADLKQSNEKFGAMFSAAQQQEIDGFIPSSPDFPGLLLTVQNIVSQARLNLDSFSVGQVSQLAANTGGSASSGSKGATAAAQAATVGGVSFQTQDVSITVSGGASYASFKNLLALFESSRRLFDVISVSYSAGGQAGPTAGSEASWPLVIRTYYLPPSK